MLINYQFIFFSFDFFNPICRQYYSMEKCVYSGGGIYSVDASFAIFCLDYLCI